MAKIMTTKNSIKTAAVKAPVKAKSATKIIKATIPKTAASKKAAG